MKRNYSNAELRLHGSAPSDGQLAHNPSQKQHLRTSGAISGRGGTQENCGTSPADNSGCEARVSEASVTTDSRRDRTEKADKTPRATILLQPILIGREDAAAALSISVASFDRLVATGQTPAPVSLRGRRLFRRLDLEAWVAAGCPDRRTFEAMAAPRAKTPSGWSRRSNRKGAEQ